MNLRKQVTSIVAATAILLGMTAGAAFAETVDSDSKETQLVVECSPTSTIELTVNGSFSLNTDEGNDQVDPLVDGFIFELDLSCNWSPNFQVNAEISNFIHDDWETVILTNQDGGFDGARLTLTEGSREYDGVYSLNPFGGIAYPPEFDRTVFSGNSSYTDGAIEDRSIEFRGFIIIPIASPGVTEVTYTGELDASGLRLAEGTYTADLTLELVIN